MFEDLLSWFQAHLHLAIQRRDPVRPSVYSQHRLRTFLGECFGRGAVPSIRSQRCGSINVPTFSRNFSRRHGFPPSQLLRRRP